MASQLADNLKFLMWQKKIANANQLQALSGLANPTTWRILNNETKSPRDETLLPYCEFFGVDLKDLKYTDLAKAAGAGSGDKAVGDWDDKTPLEEDEAEIPLFKEVEVFAGSGEGEVQEKTDRVIRMSKRTARRVGACVGDSFAYVVTGQSMSDKISEGAMCIADSSKKQIKDGKIYCFRHGVMRRTKYLHRLPDGGLKIVSHNKEFEDEIVKPGDMEQIEILGWVWSYANTESW